MGEAIYYGVARFATREQAIDAEPVIDEFLQRMGEAYDAWQERRGQQGFEPAFRAEYADVMDILGLVAAPSVCGRPPDPSNWYAGLLDSPAAGNGYEIYSVDGDVRFSGEVWHFADWSPLMAAMKRHFGAVAVGWLSDEYVEVDMFAHVRLA